MAKKSAKGTRANKASAKPITIRFVGEAWHELHNPIPEYRNAGKAAPTTPEDVADLAECFIKYIQGYITWHELRNGLKPSPPGSLTHTASIEYLEKAAQCRVYLREYGSVLCEALERIGVNSTDVRLVINCTDVEGGGESGIRLIWENTKTGLQRIALRLREGEITAGTMLEGPCHTQGQGKGKGQDPPDQASHSSDFTSARWFGRDFIFSKGQQAAVVRILWHEWETGNHAISQETIAERLEEEGLKAEHSTLRLSHVFRNPRRKGHHPAWGTMIQSVTKGVYKLCPPENPPKIT